MKNLFKFMKKDITSYLGLLFIAGAVALFILYIVLASKGEKVVGLDAYHIWGSAIFGVTLVILPQDKMVLLFVEFWESVINKFTK